MASNTFVVAKVDACIKRHPTLDTLSNEEAARWVPNYQSLSMENFQTNYPLISNENIQKHRIQNAFVAAVYMVYCSHYPLEVSVEDFWVAIAQGVSVHLNENAEKYRQLLVSHEGKKELKLRVNDLRVADSTFCLDCGIPQVTLRGSPDDFQQVIERVNQLRMIFTDVHRWLDGLIPHLKQLKASDEGQADVEWW
jgi:hypothetical protein